MPKILDDSFRRSFVILDYISDKITTVTIQRKIEILQTVIKTLTSQLGSYEAELKYKQNLYKEYQNSFL